MIVGIDLGTTNSLVSVWTDKGVRLIPNEFGEYLTPSVVSFIDKKEVLVGKTAKERLITNPESTVREFKRMMGRDTCYKIPGVGSFTPIDLSSVVIKKLVSDAEKYAGEKVDSAVISVPAYFDDHQRQATRLAGEQAGINVSLLVNEPSAAALSYHIEHIDQDEKFIVFDFGGGTLDVTVVDAFANMVEICNISGDNCLGGKDFNEAIAIDICSQNGLDWRTINQKYKEILLSLSENIKVTLSSVDEVSTNVHLGENTYEYSLTRQGLIDISSGIFKKITIVLKRLMNDAMLDIEDIAGVIMVGGSSKMPIVSTYLESLFGNKVYVDKSGDVSICKGVGIVTGINLRKDVVKDIVMTDICPFSLGIEVEGDIMSTIIPKNQTLPASRASRYYTVANNQKKIKFKVYQGEKHKASDNLLLDTLELAVPPMRKGQAYADVRFSYDLNGIFDIDIVCPINGKEIHRKRGASRGLDKEYLSEISMYMETLKQNPREIPEIKYLLEKADRIYEEGNIDQRNILEIEIDSFNKILDTCQVPECKKYAVNFALRLDKIEKTMFCFDIEHENLWSEVISGPKDADDDIDKK